VAGNDKLEIDPYVFPRLIEIIDQFLRRIGYPIGYQVNIIDPQHTLRGLQVGPEGAGTGLGAIDAAFGADRVARKQPKRGPGCVIRLPEPEAACKSFGARSFLETENIGHVRGAAEGIVERIN